MTPAPPYQGLRGYGPSYNGTCLDSRKAMLDYILAYRARTGLPVDEEYEQQLWAGLLNFAQDKSFDSETIHEAHEGDASDNEMERI
jgi:hypothetical protein